MKWPNTHPKQKLYANRKSAMSGIIKRGKKEEEHKE
jgi:hypothetical protein